MSTSTIFTHAETFNFFPFHDDQNIERVQLEIKNETGSFKYWLRSMNESNQNIIDYLSEVKNLFDEKEPNLVFLITHDKDRVNDLYLELFGKKFLPLLHVFGGKL